MINDLFAGRNAMRRPGLYTLKYQLADLPSAPASGLLARLAWLISTNPERKAASDFLAGISGACKSPGCAIDPPGVSPFTSWFSCLKISPSRRS